ncbi:MAG: phage Gp37/Gp68 family protein [Alistipes sp.]|nr:phage Gp37/Gp68 family protein [Alistipes sp.]
MNPKSTGWNPWHGCRKVSEGCRNCYVYRQDAQWGADSAQARRTAQFDLPVRRNRNGRFKVASGSMLFTCFTSDFLLEDADAWRPECWQMMALRHDVDFMFFTKRIDRLAEVLPADWGDGYDNVTIGCTVENQTEADRRLPIFASLPIRHKAIICAPLLGALDLRRWLDPSIEEVSVGGESGPDARIIDYDWVTEIRDQCIDAGIAFRFHQTGARLVKNGRLYRIPRVHQHSQARRAGIDYKIRHDLPQE